MLSSSVLWLLEVVRFLHISSEKALLMSISPLFLWTQSIHMWSRRMSQISSKGGSGLRHVGSGAGVSRSVGVGDVYFAWGEGAPNDACDSGWRFRMPVSIWVDMVGGDVYGEEKQIGRAHV